MLQPYKEGNPFPATWLRLEDTMLREISLKFWNKCCAHSLTCDSERVKVARWSLEMGSMGNGEMLPLFVR